MTDFKKKSRSDQKAVLDNIKEYRETHNPDCIDLIAYHSQQIVEKQLKFILHTLHGMDETNVEFKSHNIAKLIGLTEIISSFAVPDEIIDNCDVITSWEASSRYSEETVYDTSKIGEYTAIIFKLIKAAERYAVSFYREKGYSDEEITSKINDLPLTDEEQLILKTIMEDK